MSAELVSNLAVNGRVPAESKVVSWIHFGDLHLTGEKEQNYQDFLHLIDEANRFFGHDVQFAFLPGDNADDGTEAEYELARKAADGLDLPLFAIAGDHDFHSGKLDLFHAYLSPRAHYAFGLGAYRMIFLNAMEGETHKVFQHSDSQRQWFESELQTAQAHAETPVVFVHCYPSDFHEGGGALAALVRRYRVRLVEMGHTHYNELANDGTTVYAATRSTGQIEEGPVGFSVTTLDEGVVSWKFRPRGAGPFAMITTPCEAALIVDPKSTQQLIRDSFAVRAKCWSEDAVVTATAMLERHAPIELKYDAETRVWAGVMETIETGDGVWPLTVRCKTAAGTTVEDTVQVRVAKDGVYAAPQRAPRDQDNAIAANPARGLLGTQLGPNKNGKKW